MLIAIFIALLFLYSLVSGRLERSILTAPIVFTSAGMVVLLFVPGLRERQANSELFLRVAEMGLVLLLFTDASRTDPTNRRGAARGPSARLRPGADHQPLAPQCAPRGRVSRRIPIRRRAAGGVSEASGVLDCRSAGDERRVPVAAAVEAATHSRSAAWPVRGYFKHNERTRSMTAGR